MLTRFVRTLLHRAVNKLEAALGVETEHMHFIIDTSVGAFVSLLVFMKLATRRRTLPAAALHIARVVATRSVDCGTCVQFNVNVALQEGARPEWIVAALERRPEALPPELREVYEFTERLLQHTYQEDSQREAIRARYGDQGLVDLALGIASAQTMTLTKQALGFAKSCSKVVVTVNDAPRAPARHDHLASAAA
jgi:hypothetical protein